MKDEKINVEEIEDFLTDKGLTPYQLIYMLGKNNSSVLNLNQEDQCQFQQLYTEISNGCQDAGTKGKKLEKLISLLFENPTGSFFECRRNCRTSSNEIDLLLTWNENARMTNITAAFPCFGDTFLCECKNYDGKVDVTYVGKFYSLLSLADVKLGILIAWDGVTGRGGWDSAKGLIKKIALKEGIFIIVIDKDDLKEINEGKRHIYSLIYDKHTALRNDIDFSKYVSRHPAESDFF